MKTLTRLLVVSVWFAACQTADEKEIGLGETIRHDDFLYSAQRAFVQDSIGTLKPNGRFWVVTFRVENQAKRVDHIWTNQIAFITDERGRVYENQVDAQDRANKLQPFGWHEKHITPAGYIDSTRLVFDLPTSVKQPYLQVRGDVLMGDVFDGRLFEHTKVRLF